MIMSQEYCVTIQAWLRKVKYNKKKKKYYCQSIKNFDILLIEAMIKKSQANPTKKIKRTLKSIVACKSLGWWA